MDSNSKIYNACPNQLNSDFVEQAHFTTEQAKENTKKSKQRGASFNPNTNDNNTTQSVIIVGGGTTEEFDTALGKHREPENVSIIAVGSAAFRLDKEAQIKAGYPHAAVTGTVLLVTLLLSAAAWFLRPFPLLLFAGVYVALIMGWKLLYGKISEKLRSMEVTQ